ncbi:MAG: hypothetical protein RLZZ628_59 [Bacteroidota bacterium]|jgi:hypothetical protein
MFKQCSLLLLVTFGTNQILSAQNGFAPGIQFNDANYKQIPRRAAVPTRGQVSLPARSSLKVYAPKAGNQENSSTCLAWATAYALTIQEARQRGVTQPDEIQKLFYSPAFIYYHIKDETDTDCKGGADLLKAMNAIQQSGIVRDLDLPNACPRTLPTDLVHKAFKGVAPTFNRLIEPKETKNQRVKKALSEGNPVIIAVQNSQDPNALGHAMCVVGYQDRKDAPDDGAFEILNSIGTDWGTNGYNWITYKDFQKQVVYAVEVPPLLQLPKTGKSTELAQTAKPFNSKVQFIDATNKKMELKTASSELVKNRGAGVGKKTKSGHYIATQAVKEGFGYQILVDNDESAYVYILNFDARKVVDVLFPYNDSLSPYLGKQSGITLPSDEDMIYFDDNKGVDNCCILLSRNPLDIKDLKQKIEKEAQSTPIFAKCLEKVLGEKLAGLGDDAIRYNAQENALNLTMKTEQNIAAMIIEFEHQ